MEDVRNLFGQRGKSPNFARACVFTILLMIATTWMISYHVVSSEKIKSIETSAIQGRKLVTFFEGNVSNILRYADDYIKTVRRIYLQSHSLDDVRGYMETISPQKSIFSHVTIINENGIPIFLSDGRTERKSRPGVHTRDRAYFKDQRANKLDGVIISIAEKGRNTGLLTVRVVRRLTDDAGRFKGVIFAAVKAEQLLAFFQASRPGQRMAAEIIGTDRIIRLRKSQDGELGSGKKIDESKLWKNLRRQDSGRYHQVSQIDGHDRLWAFQKVSGFPLVVTIGTALSDILADFSGFKRQVYIGAILISAMFLILGTLIFVVLARSEKNYRKLVEHSHLGIQISLSNGKHLYANQKFVEMFGYDSAEEILSEADGEAFIAPHHRHKLIARQNAHARGEIVPDIYEYDALRKDGTIVPVQVYSGQIDWNGKPAQLRTFLDTTRRKEAEKAVQDSEARFKSFLDNSPSIMLAKDRDQKVLFVNAKYLEFHGVLEDDVIGKRGGSSLSQEKRAKAEELDQRVMLEGTTVTDNISFTSHAGATRDFLVIKFPIYGAMGDVTGIGVINTDVTEVREHETELVAAKIEAENLADKAEAASKSKSVFLATMSHEIRTPMNGVLGMADVLSKTALTDVQRDFVQTIRDSGHSLLDLLNDILDLSKIEAGHVELETVEFSVAELLAATKALWAHSAQEKGLVLFSQNNATDSDMVRGDRTRLRQVLNNLVGNAIKFTSEGKIEIYADALPRKDGLVELRFEVRDTGIGISEAQQEKVFKPFTQADSSTTRQYGGTGLGLTISQNLTVLMGGEMGLESVPGKGSTFWFTVPVEQDKGEKMQRNLSPDAPTLPTAISHSRSLRILIAEDNKINQKVVSLFLEPMNCQFDIVNNGLEAVAAVTRSEYDIVLMDIQMPEMDGVAATKQIRSLVAPVGQIPIIAMTANAMQGDREKYLQAGMSDYVTKPIDLRDLLSAIARTSGILMTDIGERTGVAPLSDDVQAQQGREEVSQEFENLRSDFDDLLNSTRQ